MQVKQVTKAASSATLQSQPTDGLSWHLCWRVNKGWLVSTKNIPYREGVGNERAL